MHQKVPQRRLKARLKTLFVMVLLFIATIAVCSVVFALVHTKTTLLSPIFVQTASPVNAIALVKSVCQRDNIACLHITTRDATSLQITLDNGSVVYIATTKDIVSQLASLQQVISQLTIRGKQFKTLDFRFDHIIMTF